MAKKQNAMDPFEIINSELNGSSEKRQQSAAPVNQPLRSAQNSTPYPYTLPTGSLGGNPNAAPNVLQDSAPNLLQGSSPLVPPVNTAAQVSLPAESSVKKTQAADTEEDSSEGSGCIGYIAKGALILFLAAVLAWIIFMPSGSLSELKDHIEEVLFGSSSDDQDLNGHDFVFHSGYETTSPSDSLSTTEPTETMDSEETTDFTENTETTAAETAVTNTAAAGAVGAAAAATTTVKKAATTTTTAAVTFVDNAASQNDTITYADSGYIFVYLKSQTVVVYDSDDDVQIAFTCSSGKTSTPTRTGNYKILNKYRWRLMIGNCYTQYASSFSNRGYLFHSIPYNRQNAGTMSNASYDKLGTPASAGCIRLCFRDAKWIYDNCPIGTYVRVVDEYAPTGIVTQTIIPRITDTAHSGWDPTDTAENNPYNN